MRPEVLSKKKLTKEGEHLPLKREKTIDQVIQLGCIEKWSGFLFFCRSARWFFIRSLASAFFRVTSAEFFKRSRPWSVHD